LEAFIARLQPEVAGAPADVTSTVTNQREAYRPPTRRTGLPPIVPIRQPRPQEAETQ
jgi:hypothetical protein